MNSDFIRTMRATHINRPAACGLGILTTILAAALLMYGLDWMTGLRPPNILYFLISLVLVPLGSAVYWIAEVNLELKYSNLQAFSFGVSSLWFLVLLASVIR